MVFSHLQAHEKDAFFALLDEYFASRPEIFSQVEGQQSVGNNALASSAASAAQRAIASNPEAASKVIASGLRNFSNTNKDTASSTSSVAASPQVSNAIGRVAAASFALSGNRDNSNGKPAPPPAPPRRNNNVSSDEPSSAGRPAVPLSSIRKFGDVDTSSAKNMFSSLRNSTANKSAVPPPIVTPPAFTQKNTFAPPPVRRVSSSATTQATPSPPPPPTRHRPPPEAESEDAEEGEWAEAIYDYTDGDSGDLELRAKQRLKIIERTSEDWWTGEVNGKQGLFPASYVKVL